MRRRSPDCYTRLRAANITCFPITDETVKKAAQVKALLGIAGEKYNPAGVGENDLLIVASACVNRQRLVSNENRQWDLPLNKAKYKIPLVCSLPQVGVTCIDFLALIQNSGEVFEGGR